MQLFLEGVMQLFWTFRTYGIEKKSLYVLIVVLLRIAENSRCTNTTHLNIFLFLSIFIVIIIISSSII
jgi:hypothetical protein